MANKQQKHVGFSSNDKTGSIKSQQQPSVMALWLRAVDEFRHEIQWRHKQKRFIHFCHKNGLAL